MARGRGKGRKLDIHGDFSVADGGSRSGSKQSDMEGMIERCDDEKVHPGVEEKTLEMENLMTGEAQTDMGRMDRLSIGSSLKQDNGSKHLDGVAAELDRGGGSKSWAAFFADNRLKGKGSELKFITPSVANGKRVVRFHSKEVVSKENRWKSSLIGCVYGIKPRVERISAFALARWRKYGLISVSRVNSELFLFQFNDEQGCEQVVEGGPFTFDNHPLILKKWQPRLILDTAACALPIWIQLPGLPWEFWTVEMLSKIGSVCGKPLYCDKCTLSKVKLGFARILVEMEATGEFPECIELADENGKGFMQKVVYEWRPLVCSKCRKFGHLQQDCKLGKVEKLQWKVKDKPIFEEIDKKT